MKTTLIGINSKYIHTNLAIRYLKANTTFPVDIKEFTIKDSIDTVIRYIEDNHYTVIAFSVYIWNITFILEVISKLKDKNLTIILGGPEVSYENDYIFQQYNVSYIIKNEGENAFHLLLSYLNGDNILIEHIPNLYYKSNHSISFTFHQTVDVKTLHSPYYFEEDLNSIQHKIQYVEASRGCPFHCAYCMASLDNKLRFLKIDQLKQDIQYLIEHGAKTFKFLDRTFNANKKIAKEIIDFILSLPESDISFQFEIVADLLQTDFIKYLNERITHQTIRFEIGIQSTNEQTTLSVNRTQNLTTLLQNIKQIQDGGKIDLHLDLIAGLPYEDYASFQSTFNHIFSIYPKELQLGFLKLLRGTPLRENKEKYQYSFLNTPPYEVISNHVLSKNDMEHIKLVEHSLDVFYNSGFLPNTIQKILTDTTINPFTFFLNLGLFYTQSGYQWIGYQLDEIYMRFNHYIQSLQLNFADYDYWIKKEYLLKHTIKPKIWWNKTDRKFKNKLINMNQSKFGSLNINDVYKYSVLIDSTSQYTFIIYHPKKTIIEFDKGDLMNEFKRPL